MKFTHKQKESRMKIEKGYAVFCLQKATSHEILTGLRDAYYRELCSSMIDPIIAHCANKMELHPSKISYRHNKTRWGSCSAKNALSLSTRLMMLPKPAITYVVIHELAHIKHKNHSQDFWQFVEMHCPNYKTLRRSMRSYEIFF